MDGYDLGGVCIHNKDYSRVEGIGGVTMLKGPGEIICLAIAKFHTGFISQPYVHLVMMGEKNGIGHVTTITDR